VFERPHQQRQFRYDNGEQIISARRAAEALFTPKPGVLNWLPASRLLPRAAGWSAATLCWGTEEMID
jgi:hypothetical protein